MATRAQIEKAMEGMTKEQKLAFLDAIANQSSQESPPPEQAPAEKSMMDKAGEFVTGLLPEDTRQALGERASQFLGTTDPEEAKVRAREFLWGFPKNVGIVVPQIPGGSYGDAVESLPAIGAAGGALAGGAPAVGGALAGEGARQGIRQMVGLPPATGLLQELMQVDPSSPEARALGFGAEALMAGGGEVLAKLVPMLIRGSRNSTQNLVQLNEKLRDKMLPQSRQSGLLNRTKGHEILDRAVSEGVVPPFSTRGAQVNRSAKALREAETSAKALEAATENQPLKPEKVQEVLDTLQEAIPKPRPGGKPKAGDTVRKTTQDILDDANNFISAERARPLGKKLQGPAGNVRGGPARAEKKRLSSEIQSLFESGAETPTSKKALARASAAWQKAINESFPELADAELRRSDLIKINEALNKALSKAEFSGTDLAAEGTGIGAYAAGSLRVPLMLAGKACALATAGPISSFSGAAKRLFAKILSSPANTQTWFRLMGQLGEAGLGSEEQE